MFLLSHTRKLPAQRGCEKKIYIISLTARLIYMFS